MLAYFATLYTCLVVMEACSGSNYWAREIQALGHQVTLISPQYVKLFVKGNKNDHKDAHAITEAAGPYTMRFVPIKFEQQDV